MQKNLIWLFSCLFFITSCDVQKRRYRGGYHFSGTNHRSVATVHEKETKHVKAPELMDLELLSRNILFENTGHTAAPTKKLATDSCDKFVMQDGSELAVSVIELGQGIIRYKRCDF